MHAVRITRRLVLALGLVLATALPAVAGPALSAPWPPVPPWSGGGTLVTFPSHSPFGLADVGGGSGIDPPVEARGLLFLPPGASAERPVPAVVLVHGAGGVLANREPTYARQLAALGVAALVIDAFGVRRHLAVGFTERLIHITEAMLLADAFAALSYLDGRAEVDGGRVALVGFSYGGMVSMYAAFAQVAERYAPDGRRFAGHVAYYAPCIAEFVDHRTTGAPVLMLAGDGDELVDPGRCAATDAQLRAGGAEVRRVTYAGAFHQWDGHFARPRPIGRNLAPCRYRVGTDGTVWDQRWHFPISNPTLRKVSLGLCTDPEGYTIGRDDAVRARANRDLGAFLERVFDPR